MEFSAFQYSVDNGVAHITLNQPELGNPINKVFCDEFNDLSIVCGEDPAVRAVLIDANGANFSVGGDLKSFINSQAQLAGDFKWMTSRLHMGVSRFSRMDAPVIVAADNLVVGGGAALVAGADFVISSDRARYYAAFATIAVCGDTGMSYFLPRRVGTRRAAEFLIQNKMWSAQQALDYGLISELVSPEQLAERSMELAVQLAQGPTGVYGKMKRLLLSSFDQPLEMQLENEANGMVACARTEDAWNAINAIISKQKPVYNNK
jgi:2-(1,2-epoxy-1,2-dihydrophenyl)acetyl-CoA isomerase